MQQPNDNLDSQLGVEMQYGEASVSGYTSVPYLINGIGIGAALGSGPSTFFQSLETDGGRRE